MKATTMAWQSLVQPRCITMYNAEQKYCYKYGVELSDSSRRQQFVQSEEIKWMWKEMAWYVSEFRKTRYCASFDVVM